MENLTPQAMVAELNKYIVGQHAAKRAMAVALRNRYRRSQLPEEVRREISPKNILMIGPTGVGKTEIARRIARMIDAPFVKVEATKFTEVGYVGRDVESIIQDIVETGISMVHEEKMKDVQARAEMLATERIITYLLQQMPGKQYQPKSRKQQPPAIAMPVGANTPASAQPAVAAAPAMPGEIGSESKLQVTEDLSTNKRQRTRIAKLLSEHQLDDTVIEIETSGESEAFDSVIELPLSLNMDEVMNESIGDFMSGYTGSNRKRTRRVSVKEARRILMREESNKLIDWDSMVEDAVSRVEESGVVFIDEIDKLVGPKIEVGADISGEGVQRDLLPIVEGSTVMTRYGPVKTDHMLFIAAGAFYEAKPSDLIPELQGRFPLRVELSSLALDDMRRILTEPQNSLTKQYHALMSTEGVEIEFTADGIDELARTAVLMNERMEDIGARRLHTIMERVLEELSFTATEMAGQKITLNAEYVRQRLNHLVKDEDLSRYIL